MELSLLERHLDEAGFLWDQREAAARAPHYDLASLAGLDERLEAQIDALRLGGDEGWAFCKKGLEQAEPGTVFAAGCVALASGILSAVADVLDVASTTRAFGDALVRALAWVPLEQARPVLSRLLSPKIPPVLQGFGLSASAERCIDPGRALDAALAHEDQELVARAGWAAGVLGDPARQAAVRALRSLDHGECRLAGAWSGVLLGDAAAAALLPELVLRARRQDDTCELLALVEEGRELSTLPPRLAARYAGASGDLRHVPWLLERMREPDLARVSAEAFAMLTGADLSGPPLRASAPDGHQAGPSDDLADPRVDPDPDDDLPWPNVNAIGAWWSQRATCDGKRMLCGQAHSEAWLGSVLRSGKQRERAVAALALKLAHQGRPLFPVRAPAFMQVRALGVQL